MYRNVYFVFLLAFALITGCGGGGSEQVASGSKRFTLTHDGVNREYAVILPDNYDSETALPVVLNFHGYGGRALEYIIEADMRPEAQSAPFILVYPQGSLLNGVSHWNASLPGPDNKSNADDLGFVRAMIEQLSENYTVDSERIYAVGYSNGGMFSYALACQLSEKIAAIGSVSGTMLDGTCNPSRPIPVIIFHGTEDSVIPYEGDGDWNSVETVLNHWIQFNGTGIAPANIRQNGNIEYSQYVNENNGIAVEHYKINDGEHIWFTQSTDSLNTSEQLWQFLSQYDLNGER
ncbi:hypothetical protein CS022_05970 [Veronia nyctiphanis]|uniref:Phospholipase/carboxylesterase/thioesterase domain-containing protein n=1 Tax=Veronia nyctiphanis TaxID=1278244 RepID=A0A4Q0YYK8_9GAMM|nr:PHB depolymerase family esterase [Veronia nyctiphanis]RXJ74161.1 hypothetical protein CS022_05970 [Veronia nyctiphanis]